MFHNIQAIARGALTVTTAAVCVAGGSVAIDTNLVSATHGVQASVGWPDGHTNVGWPDGHTNVGWPDAQDGD